MAEKGWICIHRKIRECWIWEDKPFAMGQAWIHLLLRANHEDGKMLFDKKLITIRRGQILTSIRKLSTEWGWSKERTSNFLSLLEQDNMLIKKSSNRATLLTIINYGVYQDLCDSHKDTDKDTERTVTGTQGGQSLATNNNVNNDNNVNNKERGKSRNFSPPSLDEVREYCLSRNNGIDPGHFIDFYASKGWMVGKNKMKDWKAAVRTWEGRNKQDTKKPERAREESADEYAEYNKKLLEDIRRATQPRDMQDLP